MAHGANTNHQFFPDPAGDDGLLFQDAPNLPELLKALGPYYEP